jgi:hypothetical protein
MPLEKDIRLLECERWVIRKDDLVDIGKMNTLVIQCSTDRLFREFAVSVFVARKSLLFGTKDEFSVSKEGYPWVVVIIKPKRRLEPQDVAGHMYRSECLVITIATYETIRPGVRISTLLSLSVKLSHMYHHLQRAAHIYRERGLESLLKTAVTFAPVEVNNMIFHLRHGYGSHIMDEDWDTLVLLDGCRYDMFREQVSFEGTLESRTSLGSTSEEFFERNFQGETHQDTVYINTNAYLPKIGMYENETFYTIVDLLDEWDDDLEVVHPKTVVNAARRTHETFPNKRIIVHFMQPHYPFIGEYGQQIQEGLEGRSVWRPLQKGEIDLDLDQVWRAYNENLGVVLSHLEELIKELDGKTVISADHGNMVGERQGPIPTWRLYGHYWGIYSPELVNVPWFVCDYDGRREIQADAPEAVESKSDEVVQDRLEALGYVE